MAFFKIKERLGIVVAIENASFCPFLAGNVHKISDTLQLCVVGLLAGWLVGLLAGWLDQRNSIVSYLVDRLLQL